MNITELFSAFPYPKNPLAPKPRRSIKLAVLKVQEADAKAELERLSGPESVGSPAYFQAEAKYNRLRVELQSKLAVRAEIERLRSCEVHYGQMAADAEAEAKALRAELKAVEARDPDRVTGEAYRLTNKAMELAWTIQSCEELITGGNKYDNLGTLVLGFKGQRELLEKRKAESGDED